jgi:hypothetical protein
MGNWGTGIFENDTAMDFVGGLGDHPENAENVLREALETAAHMDDGELDSDEGAGALAAAAVVSIAQGDSPVTPPESLEDNLRQICRHVPIDLAPLAIEAIDKVLGDESELRELWGEAESLDEWQAEAHAVRHHLAS